MATAHCIDRDNLGKRVVDRGYWKIIAAQVVSLFRKRSDQACPRQAPVAIGLGRVDVRCFERKRIGPSDHPRGVLACGNMGGCTTARHACAALAWLSRSVVGPLILAHADGLVLKCERSRNLGVQES